MGSPRTHQLSLDCNRLSPPVFVVDILPLSHTATYKRQGIEACVREQVQAWDYTRPLEVFLTSGYGHPLRWLLYEFKPATAELLQQNQYLKDVKTGQSVRFKKWSPPLGITKLEPGDVWKFERYLGELMSDELLPGLPWKCFAEESQFHDFQASMLDMICKLYLSTTDRNVSILHTSSRSLALIRLSSSERFSANSYAWSSSPTSWAIPSQSPRKRFPQFTNTWRTAQNPHN